MFIGKTDSRRPLTISLSVSSALLGLVVFVLLSAAPATIYAAELAPFTEPPYWMRTAAAASVP